MNQTFNIHRFAMMLKLDFADKGRSYLLMTALYIIALLLLMGPVTMSNEFSPSRELLHYLALIMVVLFGTSLITNMAISQFADPKTSLSALMVPASRMEKFLSSFLINLVFIICYIVLFWQLHYTFFDMANAGLKSPLPRYRYIPKDIMRYATFAYFAIHATVFLGSAAFIKSAYIKTSFLAAIIVLLVSYFHYYVASEMIGIPSKLTAMPLSGWKVWLLPENGVPTGYASMYYDFALSPDVLFGVQAFTCLVIIMLWLAAYFQLREREI